jgi:hypothetical protein
MRDRRLIVAGLLLVAGVVTAPAWFGVATGAPRTAPVLELPKSEKACVMPTDYMKTSHAALLSAWREKAVRQHDRRFVRADGRVFAISLTGTCLDCHANKAAFCDRCHAYAGVAPTCWDCHVDPALARGGRR